MTNIRRIIINAILIIGFPCIVFVIITPLRAELQFSAAKRLQTGYLWDGAEEGFMRATKIDPYNSQYLAGLGDFFLTKSAYTNNNATGLINAEKMYKAASRLNPRCAEYWLRMGEISVRRSNSTGAIKYFRRAVSEDPNGFNISYSVGYAGILLWNSLSGEDREFILDRLKYSLKAKPWYSEYIYPRLLEQTKDYELLLAITPIFRHSGKGSYKDGNMYWSGTWDIPINMPDGFAVIKIKAKGTSANGIYPLMAVELDGINIGQLFVNSSEWKEYNFRVKTGGGVKILSISFVNDGGNAKEDRNLYVGDAKVVKDER